MLIDMHFDEEMEMATYVDIPTDIVVFYFYEKHNDSEEIRMIEEKLMEILEESD